MAITKKSVTRASLNRGRPGPVRMVVLHATAGSFPGDHDWLLKGGGIVNGVDVPVSIHYYIDKRGRVTQMVEDADTAWHAGKSRWLVDGKQVAGGTCNPISIGIELENRNTGRDPYPAAQYNATLELTRDLVKRFNVPRNQLVRHLDISPGRKTDPAAFPWAQFVNDVYASPAGPRPEQLTASQQLRAVLIDLAYRAARAGAPPGWPLLKASISRGTGMPIGTLSTPREGEHDGEDLPNRPLLLPNQPPLVAELYARDLYYIPLEEIERPEAVKSWSATPSGELRHLLAVAMFEKNDPAQGFRPESPLHQAFLGRIADTGVPIGPLQRLQTVGGTAYLCQHFAVDSLCAPVDQPGAVTRLSDLTRGMYEGDPHSQGERELRTLLLDDLYRTRTGRAFDADALFCRFAIRHNLGAPIAKAEPLTVDGQKLVAMPYALDVLFCRVPADGNWDNVAVGVLSSQDEGGLALLSGLLEDGVIDEDLLEPPETLSTGPEIDELLPDQEYSAGVLGVMIDAPAIVELADLDGHAGAPRDGAAPETIVVYPTRGTTTTDLAAVAAGTSPAFHYYVSQDGTITRLIEEQREARGGRARAIAVAVEGASGGEPQPDSPQATALTWLLQDIAARYGIARERITQSEDLGEPIKQLWTEALPSA